MHFIRGSFGHRKAAFWCISQNRNISVQRKPILYGDEASPPVRFVMITASLLKTELDFHKIDLFKGENKLDFYKKINPLQKVPALELNGEVIADSQAIALHLCRSIPNDLYPEDVFIRTRVEEMMFYNAGVLFPIDSAIYTDFFAGKWPADENKLTKWYDAMDYLEKKLDAHKFLTGHEVRLCDLCCGTTVSSLEILVPLCDRHEKVKEWLKNLKSLPGFEINDQGLHRLLSFVNTIKTNMAKKM
ncbi:glutathione S-transferase 1-like [Anticarsia gemmatalis]|uniref:glutathione S-transferase 1-like n=1 Tax=Anticarsia gemmatalis TaxID=129554 RepID=UPI003F774DC2